VAVWLRFLAGHGFHGPLWVTETGYPADPAWQTDPGYRNGAVSQPRWMTTVIPAMLTAGAAMVFVTSRDSLTGRFASEGVLQTITPNSADPAYVPRPSFYAVRALARSTLARRDHSTRRVVRDVRRVLSPLGPVQPRAHEVADLVPQRSRRRG
jgi:hypothetical protein